MYNLGEYARSRGSFVEPINDPGVDPDTGPFVSVLLPLSWLSIVVGCLSQLYQRTTWNTADEAALNLAVDRARLLTNLLGGPLTTAPGVTPTSTVIFRSNPTTHLPESSLDGGTTWTPAPGMNPQVTTYLPPQTGTNAACNSAASEVAYLSRMSDMLATTISPAITAGGLGYAILSVLLDLTGPWGLLLDVIVTAAAGLLDAGVTAIASALTSTNLNTLECILYCRLNTLNQLTAVSLTEVEEDVTAALSTDDASILNGLLSLQGFGGINDAMAQHLDTDDCSGCSACVWCETFDFTLGQLGWTPTATGPGAVYHSAVGFGTNDIASGASWARLASIIITFPSTTITKVRMEFSYTYGSISGTPDSVYIADQAGTRLKHDITPPANGNADSYEWSGSHVSTAIQCYLLTSYHTAHTFQGAANIFRVTIRGTGTNPFGVSNC